MVAPRRGGESMAVSTEEGESRDEDGPALYSQNRRWCCSKVLVEGKTFLQSPQRQRIGLCAVDGVGVPEEFFLDILIRMG